MNHIELNSKAQFNTLLTCISTGLNNLSNKKIRCIQSKNESKIDFLNQSRYK